MDSNCNYRRVRIAPLELLKQSISLMGDQYWIHVAIVLIAMLLSAIVPLGILTGPMMCGIYLCLFKRAGGKRVALEDLFQGFDYFLESLIATLIITIFPQLVLLVIIGCFGGVVAVLFVTLGESGWPVVVAVIAVGGLITAAVAIILSALFLFVYPLIVDRNLKAVPAILTSCAAVWGNLGGVLLLLLVYGLFSIVATLACGIGTFFLAPVMLGAFAVLYRQVFPTGRDDSESEPAADFRR